MTQKQVAILKRLACHTMQSTWLNENQRIKQYMEIMEFLRLARDLYLIDEKKRQKIAEEIGDAAMAAYKDHLKREEEQSA